MKFIPKGSNFHCNPTDVISLFFLTNHNYEKYLDIIETIHHYSLDKLSFSKKCILLLCINFQLQIILTTHAKIILT